MSTPLLELGGVPDAPPLHIAVANGFVPQTYLPLLRPFMDRYRVLALPPRALWGNETPPAAPHVDWQHLRDDLLAGIAVHDLHEVTAIGHSFGGVASLLAVLEAPQRFKALILLDPTLLTRQMYAAMKAARQAGRMNEHPLVQMALRRRRHFESVDDAFDRFREKALFAGWSDEVLRLYVEHGTQAAAEGGRTLTWSPEWEAFYFSSAYVDIWDELPKLQNSPVPMLFIAGGNSDTFVPESAALLREMLPNAAHATIDGHGHLFPQSAPQQSAKIIAAWLDQLT